MSFLVVSLALVVYTRVPCFDVSITIVSRITSLPVGKEKFFKCLCYGF